MFLSTSIYQGRVFLSSTTALFLLHPTLTQTGLLLPTTALVPCFRSEALWLQLLQRYEQCVSNPLSWNSPMIRPGRTSLVKSWLTQIIQQPTATHPVHRFLVSVPKSNTCPPNPREQYLCIHPHIATCQRAAFAKPSKFVPGSLELTWVAIWGLEHGKIDVSEGKHLQARAVT